MPCFSLFSKCVPFFPFFFRHRTSFCRRIPIQYTIAWLTYGFYTQIRFLKFIQRFFIKGLLKVDQKILSFLVNLTSFLICWVFHFKKRLSFSPNLLSLFSIVIHYCLLVFDCNFFQKFLVICSCNCIFFISISATLLLMCWRKHGLTEHGF